MQNFTKIGYVIRKKCVGKGSFLYGTPGSNKGLKTPNQIELPVNFIYNKVSINCFFREQLPYLIYVGCMFYHYKDSTSYQRFLIVQSAQ